MLWEYQHNSRRACSTGGEWEISDVFIPPTTRREIEAVSSHRHLICNNFLFLSLAFSPFFTSSSPWTLWLQGHSYGSTWAWNQTLLPNYSWRKNLLSASPTGHKLYYYFDVGLHWVYIVEVNCIWSQSLLGFIIFWWGFSKPNKGSVSHYWVLFWQRFSKPSKGS